MIYLIEPFVQSSHQGIVSYCDQGIDSSTGKVVIQLCFSELFQKLVVLIMGESSVWNDWGFLDYLYVMPVDNDLLMVEDIGRRVDVIKVIFILVADDT